MRGLITRALKRFTYSSKKYADRQTLLVKLVVVLSPLIIYLIFSLIFFGPNSFGELSKDIFSNSGDPQQFIWFYNWWPFSLAHHLNPFVTRFPWYPLGYNLAWPTSIPTLSLLLAPVTLLGNAVLSFNLAALLSPVLAATTCFYLVRHITKQYLPSLIAGYIYGFSSFEITELLGHPQVYADFLIPVVVLLFLLRFEDKLKTIPYVILTGLLLALQFGISTEVFATFIVFSCVALVVFYLSLHRARKALVSATRQSGLALALAIVLLSPYLYFMAIGHKEVPNTIHPIIPFSANAANYFIPSPVTLVGGSSLMVLSRHFTANLSENGAYLGLPLLIILAYIAIKYWRKKAVRATIILLAIIMLASLGPRLHIIGQVGTAVPLPWALVSWLPLLKSAQPDRFTLYVFLVVAVIVGVWLAMGTTRKNPRLKYAAVVLGMICIMPNPAQYTWSSVPVPPVFKKPLISRYIPKGSNIIILPFERYGSSNYYQYASGMYFTQTGAYVGFVPADYASNPVVESFFGGAPELHFAQDLKGFCANNHVTRIIYLPQTPAALVKAINSLGWPTRHAYGAVIVTTPEYAASHKTAAYPA